MSSQDVEESKLGNQVNLSHATQTMNTNPIKTAMDVCSKLIQRKVSVMNRPKYTLRHLHQEENWLLWLSREAKISTPLNQGGIGLLSGAFKSLYTYFGFFPCDKVCLGQACKLAVGKKTQGQKTQNSRKKLKRKTQFLGIFLDKFVFCLVFFFT